MRALSLGRSTRVARSRLTLASTLACTLLVTAACNAPDAPATSRLSARVHAQSREGLAVAGVRLWADGRELGTTDAAGTLEATLEARDGARVVVTAACPSAYRTLDERREVVVRPLRAAPGRAGPPGLQLSVSCEPLELLSALVVRVRGEAPAGLPLRVRDRVVGQTGPDGTAQLVLRTRPDASLTIELDTSQRPELEPRSPVQTFQLGEQPEVLLFAPSLTRTRPKQRGPHAPGAAPHPASAPHRLPYRVD